MSSISWTDSTGAATLENPMPAPANRVFNWTPRDESIGPLTVRLDNGRIYGPKYRRDGLVSFELRYLPGSELPLALRLKLHLMKGGTVTLATDNQLASRWATATLAPETMPTIKFDDPVTLEYTFGVTLREG